MSLQQAHPLVSGYTILVQIHASDKAIVYRACRQEDGLPVILKIPRGDPPKNEHLEAIKHEYSLLLHLKDVSGINQVIELISHPKLTLVKEDQGTISLKEYLAGKALDVEEFIPIAIKISKILGGIHSKHVIHKDINPSNITIHPETKEIQFIDFSLSSQLDEENQTEIYPQILEGTLPYIAPERTGRMNRPFDYRSDFYSLGVTFYEMLSGNLPFESKDPLEIIHYHIARPTPILLHIPRYLAQVIAKLMSKNPDDRYFTAFGLEADLIKCRDKEDFILGENDASDRFTISHKLYGREGEIREILNSYEKVSLGDSIFLLLSGYSGIGKTSLVHEVYQPMTQNKGIFISGKFDQLQRNIAYSGFVQAFNNLIHQILSEPKDKLDLIKNQILDKLSLNAQLLIDIIPDLELLIGKQPSIAPLDAQDEQSRFIFTFQNFIKIFAQADHPLTIFLDDLQWADSGSLKLLEIFMNDTSLQYLFIIGAYRDNEVDDCHPLMITIEDLRKANVNLKNITLRPLKQDDISSLINDSFKKMDFDSIILAKEINNKTNGNPFFINEFIKLLYTENFLRFNHLKRAWDIDLTAITVLKITDNVVDLMIQKIQKLSTSTVEILKIAACIGHTFKLQDLSILCNKPPLVIQGELWEALRAGLIYGENYKKFEEEDPRKAIKAEYRFVHDRIQQAAYSLIPSEIYCQQQLNIGRLLLKEWKKTGSVENLPTIINHFNDCLSLLTEKEEKLELATFYHKVGKDAKRATAYETSLNYFHASSTLLEPHDWKNNYELLFNNGMEMAECELLTGNFKEAERQFSRLLSLTQNNLDKAKITHLMMTLFLLQGRLDLSIKLGLDHLKLFNIYIPEKPSFIRVFIEILKIKLILKYKDIEKLDQTLKRMEDPIHLAISKTLFNLLNSTFQLKYLFPLVAFKYFRLFLSYGYSPQSAVVIGAIGVIFYRLNDFKTGEKLINLGKKFIETSSQETKNMFLNQAAALTSHFVKHMSNGFETFTNLYKTSLEFGDLGEASMSLYYKAFTVLYSGKSLELAESSFMKAVNFCLKIKRMGFVGSGQAYLKLIKYLRGDLSIAVSDVDALATQVSGGDNVQDSIRMGIALELAFYLNDPAKVLEIGRKFYVDHSECLMNFYMVSPFLTVYALGIFDCYAKNPELITKEHWKHLKQIMKQIKKWEEVCPVNYKHQDLLLQAEMARFHLQEQKAFQLYDEGINAAAVNGFKQFVAIINERFGSYLFEINKQKFAKSYIQEAFNNYNEWGANVKANMLEQKFPHWFTREVEAVSTSMKMENIDLLSISKATQAISKEIDLDRLLTQIIRVLLENAAAQRVVLLQSTPLQILGQGTFENISVSPGSGPSFDNVPISLLNYVLRSKQPIVLQDAANLPVQFQKELYFLQNSIKSVLCAPILYQSKVMGLLYLENNLTTHAFTENRLKILNILSSQAAISLQNARFFERMNQLYRSTERFVPKPFLDLLQKESIEDIQLGDCVVREVSVLFTDLRNFTSIAQKRSPQDTFEIINRYLAYMAPIIRNHRGFINQILGDGILALFPEAPEDGIKGGLAMLFALKEFNEKQRKLGDLELEMGISLNTGKAMLGICGEKERIEPSVISDVTNTASRIESLNKTYKTHFLISDSSFHALKSKEKYLMRRIDKVYLKGRDVPTNIYQVIDWAQEYPEIIIPDYLLLFDSAFGNYEKGNFEIARFQFQECLAVFSKDRVSLILAERCEKFLREGMPPNWDGAFLLKHK